MPVIGPIVLTNRARRSANDLHIIFTDSGGTLGNPAIVQGPAPSSIKASGNTVDITWDDALIPPGGQIGLTVQSRAPNPRPYSIRWTRNGRTLPQLRTRPMVRDREGQLAPFQSESIVGSLVIAGMDAGVAQSHARTLETIVHASGSSEVSINAIHFALGELISARSPDLGVIAAAVRGDEIELGAADEDEEHPSEDVAPEISDDPVERVMFSFLGALSNLESLSERNTPGISSPLGELLSAAADTLDSGAPLFADAGTEMRRAYGAFLDALREGTHASANPDLYQAWQTHFIAACDTIVSAFDEHPSLAFSRCPVIALRGTLHELGHGFASESAERYAWQIPVLNALAKLPRKVELNLPSTELFKRLTMLLKHDCPPCHDDCPYSAATLYKTGTLTNPHKCKTSDHTIKKVPFMHVWVRKCEWDAAVRYKRVYQCRKNWLDPFGATICCWSIYEWQRKETWTYTQQIISFSGTVPDDWDDAVTDYRTGDKNTAPPADATKTY